MHQLRILFSLTLVALLWYSCSDPVFTPKPRSYPKVDFPKKAFQPFTEDFCNFTFEYPVYTEIQQDTNFFEEMPPHDCWFDLFYPSFDGRVHFTYVDLRQPENNLEKLRQESFNMADWHNKRANYIDELLIQTANGVSGIAFDIDGPAASPFQFFLTDSTQNFVRGALYFNTHVQADSLAPVIDFVREDILHLIETFEWK
jgi:gliding motility-associated lipoprotein GldD